jgi:hypothetical protein
VTKILILLIGIIPLTAIGMNEEIQPPSYDFCISGEAPFYQPEIDNILYAYNLYLPQLDSGEDDELNAKLADAQTIRANPYNAVLQMQFDQRPRSLDHCRPECRPCIKGVLCLACSIPVIIYDAVAGSCLEDDDDDTENIDACCQITRRLIHVMQE